MVLYLDGTDYLGYKYQLTFANTSTNGSVECLYLEIFDDNIKEENETFLAVLSPGGDEAVHLLNHYAEVHIHDDDSMSLSGVT